MTRAEQQLYWWRQGFEAGLAAGERQRVDHGLAVHHAAIAEFHARRRADGQAVADALVLETVDVLAREMLGHDWRLRRRQVVVDELVLEVIDVLARAMLGDGWRPVLGDQADEQLGAKSDDYPAAGTAA